MSPASQGGASLEVERYIGTCLISNGTSGGGNTNGFGASYHPHHYHHQPRPAVFASSCRGNQEPQQQYARTGFKHNAQPQLRAAFEAQQFGAGAGGSTWAGGAPLISMTAASNYSRRAAVAAAAAATHPSHLNQDNGLLHRRAVNVTANNNRVQGAPLVLPGRFANNSRPGKMQHAVETSANQCNQTRSPPKNSPSASSCQGVSERKDGEGGVVANIDSLSVASDESSSSSNNSENSLPRIIKPRKRRKKDRGKPNQPNQPQQPQQVVPTPSNLTNQAPPQQQQQNSVNDSSQFSNNNVNRQQHVFQQQQQPPNKSYDGSRYYAGDHFYQKNQRACASNRSINNNNNSGFYNQQQQPSGNKNPTKSCSDTPREDLSRGVVDSGNRQPQQQQQRNGNNRPQQQQVKVALLDDNRNVILPPDCVVNRAGSYFRASGEPVVPHFQLPDTSDPRLRHQIHSTPSSPAADRNFQGPFGPDPIPAIWELNHQQVPYHTQFGSYSGTHPRVAQSMMAPRHHQPPNNDVPSLQGLRISDETPPQPSASILRRSWSDPTSYFFAPAGDACREDELVPNRDVGVIGDRGGGGASTSTTTTTTTAAGSGAVVLSSSFSSGTAGAGMPTSARCQTASPPSPTDSGSSPTSGSSSSNFWWSDQSGSLGPLEVSTEIVTSPNGHRDLEIKFYSSSPTTTTPSSSEDVFGSRVGDDEEDDVEEEEEEADEISDIWKYHENKLQQDFRTLLQTCDK